MPFALSEAMRQCTVRLSVPGQPGHGTGFFVAPMLILTCAHVVKGALKQGSVEVFWNNQLYPASIAQSLPELDIALVSLDFFDHPCVYIQDGVEPFDKLYSYGYSDLYAEGEPASFLLEGKAHQQAEQREHLKLKTGQVRPGLSGAPLLNMRTGAVCGMIQKSRDRESDLGGRAIPIETVLTTWPDLKHQQHTYHHLHPQWMQGLKNNSSRSITHTSRKQHNRLRMLQRIKSIWIQGVLKHSLSHEPMLTLSLQEDLADVENAWSLSVQETNVPARLLAPGTPVVQAFDDAGGDLLILGEPGAGKTTLLLELASQLLERAEQDEGYPIPVVLNLSSWAQKWLPLAEWMVEELFTKYQVPREIGKRWVDAEQVMLLLDGFDEVSSTARKSCLSAINVYHQRHPLTPLVVCSRTHEYKQVFKKLQLQSAITIQPLTHEQIEDALMRGGDRLAALRKILQEDRVLADMVQTPLMLTIMIIAYAGCSLHNLPTKGSVQERRTQIFETYVKRMLTRRSKSHIYEPSQVCHWLRWLARQLQEHQQTELFLERMQPDWIDVPKYKQMYLSVVCFKAMFAAIVLEVVALWATSPFWTAIALPEQAKFTIPISSVLMGISTLFFAAIYAKEIKPVELLTWSWSWKRMWNGFCSLKMPKWYYPCASIFISLCGVAAYSTGKTHLEGLKLDLVAFLVTSLLLFVGPRLFFAIELGWIEGQLEEKELLSPNEGIKRSARNGRHIGLFYFFGIVAFFVLLSIPTGLFVGNLVAIMRLGMALGILFGLGAATQKWLLQGHLALIQQRTLFNCLERTRAIPRNYQQFLEYASERILLQKVGGGYRFIHRYVQEYFLTEEPEIVVARQESTSANEEGTGE